ncbi:nuclear protein [Moniliophthora roreri]|nr:nuclear protein [Moniliophthora roreri]
MAKSHARSPSPSSDPTPLIKRLKTAHTTNSVDDVIASFAPEVLDHHNIAKLNKEYKESEPFRYALVEKLFQDDLLRNVKDECMSELNFTTKETDIYKARQSQISLLPNLLKLRDALYSPQFRSFLRSVTGCGPLSGIKQDMSVNSYTKGCHLLNHDDVIGTRRVSYILYMPLPHYQVWPPAWGGALELYPVKPNEDGILEPESVPMKSVAPSWNQFIFFEVQPGRSFHSVEEVIVGEGEDTRVRLSISGWFHAAQEGEEGYEPPSMEPEMKSSRDQLAESQTNFKSYSTSETVGDAPPLPDMELSEEHISFLSEFLNPVYLQPHTMKALAGRFIDESSLELHSFLSSDLAHALEPRLRDLDAKDGLGPEREGRIPPHSAGVDLPSNISNGHTNRPSSATASNGTKTTPSAWTIKGPPHKHRYCTLLPPSPSAPAISITPLSAHPSPSEILRVLQDELFPSQAFRAWLAIVTRLLPLRFFVEARRFRPGLDYTLATSEEKEARLDVVLGLTPEIKGPENTETSTGRRRAIREKPPVRGWSAAEWGGWECYMAPHNEEDDPAVYRSGTYKKSDALANGKPQRAENGHANGSVPNGKPASNSVSSDGKSKSPSPSHSEDADGDVEIPDAEEDEEDDSTLLTVQPGFNRLLLVLRDERVMRFVKYVSAAAEGSRWDVCAEYEVGMMQEDEGDEAGEA